jgi:hypothetical protein
MLKAAIPDKTICEIAECTQETIDNIRKNNTFISRQNDLPVLKKITDFKTRFSKRR